MRYQRFICQLKVLNKGFLLPVIGIFGSILNYEFLGLLKQRLQFSYFLVQFDLHFGERSKRLFAQDD